MGDIEEKRCARVDGTVDRTRCSFEPIARSVGLPRELQEFAEAWWGTCARVAVFLASRVHVQASVARRARGSAVDGRGVGRFAGPRFRAGEAFDLPFLIREHGRKFQLGVSEGTVWCHR